MKIEIFMEEFEDAYNGTVQDYLNAEIIENIPSYEFCVDFLRNLDFTCEW